MVDFWLTKFCGDYGASYFFCLTQREEECVKTSLRLKITTRFEKLNKDDFFNLWSKGTQVEVVSAQKPHYHSCNQFQYESHGWVECFATGVVDAPKIRLDRYWSRDETIKPQLLHSSTTSTNDMQIQIAQQNEFYRDDSSNCSIC